MHLTTKVRYGTRAMAELARVYPEEALSLKDVAEQQQLSVKYLEQIMRALKSSGLVKSVRGAHGGYELAKAPGEITLRDVFDALEGSAALAECVEDPDSCPMHKTCPTRDIWVQMTESVTGILDKTTLQDIVNRMKEKSPPRDSYEI